MTKGIGAEKEAASLFLHIYIHIHTHSRFSEMVGQIFLAWPHGASAKKASASVVDDEKWSA